MNDIKHKLDVHEVFHKISLGIKNNPGIVESINGIYLFRISGPNGGLFHVNLKDNPGICNEEKPAECILEVKDRDFMKLVKGVLPGFKAMLNGKLVVKGDLTLATRLNEMFRAAQIDRKIK